MVIEDEKWMAHMAEDYKSEPVDGSAFEAVPHATNFYIYASNVAVNLLFAEEKLASTQGIRVGLR